MLFYSSIKLHRRAMNDLSGEEARRSTCTLDGLAVTRLVGKFNRLCTGSDWSGSDHNAGNPSILREFLRSRYSWSCSSFFRSAHRVSRSRSPTYSMNGTE